MLGEPIARVPGTAIFLSPDPNGVPHALLNNLMHNHVFHERVVFLTVASSEIPWVDERQRVSVKPLGQDCYQVTMNYGFMDEVNLPRALEACKTYGLLSRASVVATGGKGMAVWRERLFGIMLHNVGNVAAYLKLPTNRVIELGARVEI